MVQIPAASCPGVLFEWKRPVLSVTFHVCLYNLQTRLECLKRKDEWTSLRYNILFSHQIHKFIYFFGIHELILVLIYKWIGGKIYNAQDLLRTPGVNVVDTPETNLNASYDE